MEGLCARCWFVVCCATLTAATGHGSDMGRDDTALLVQTRWRHAEDLLGHSGLAADILQCGTGENLDLVEHAHLLHRSEEHPGCSGGVPRSSPLKNMLEWVMEDNALLDGYWNHTHMALDVDSIRRGLAPAGHIGARLRWHKVLSKMLRGEHVVMSVLGGSMTTGHGTSQSWVKRFETLFRARGYNVTMLNMAVPATNAVWFQNKWKRIRNAYDWKNTDIFLIDYSVNDGADGKRISKKPGPLKSSLSFMVGKTLSHGAAVLDLETYTYNTSGQGISDCATKHDGIHWSVLKELEVPTVSYQEAACHAWNHTMWLPVPTVQHPTLVTHDVVARVMVAAFFLEMEQVCHSGVDGLDHGDIDTDGFLSKSEKCLSEPSTDLDAVDGEAKFAPTNRTEVVWRYYEDRPGKPGWIAAGDGVSGDISFDIDINHGYIQTGFLGTYENIGSAVCWLDSANPGPGNQCQLNGLVAEHTSMPHFMFMRTSQRGHHVFKCRSDGQKFKMLSLKAC